MNSSGLINWSSPTRISAVAGLVAALTLAACGGSTSKAAPSTVNEPITIGLIDSETGSQALDGKLSLDAVSLEVNSINKSGGVGGHPLKVITLNNNTTNSGTVSAFEQLASDPTVVAIIGTPISGNTLAVIPADVAAQIPYFLGGSDPSLTRKGDPWLIRTRPTDIVTAKVVADFAKQMKVSSATVVNSTDSFGTGAAALAVKDLQADGTHVTSIGYVDSTPDFTPTALAVQSAGAKAVILYTTMGEDSGRLVKALAQAGVTPSNSLLIGMASSPTTPSLQIGGSAWNGAYMVSDAFCGANTLTKQFCQEFDSTYHLAPDLNSTYSYDAVKLIAAAVEKSGKATRSAIRSGVLSLKGFTGLEPGVYKFDKYNDPIQADHILKVVNGKLTFFEDIS